MAVRRVLSVVLALVVGGPLAIGAPGDLAGSIGAADGYSNDYAYDRTDAPLDGSGAGRTAWSIHRPNSRTVTNGGQQRLGYDDRSNLAGAIARLVDAGSAPQATRPLFSQTTASPTFRHGAFAGETVGDVAGGLRAGKIGAADLPIDVIVRNGETIGLNTRSMLALRRGGIDPADWLLNDVTGVPGMERLLTERLLRNQLTGGTDVLRITGAGPNASNLR